MAVPITTPSDFLPLRARAFFSYTGLVIAHITRTGAGQLIRPRSCIDAAHKWTDAPVVLRGTLEGSDGLA